MIKPIFYKKISEFENNNSIKYILSIGKRQPMHIGHKKNLERIMSLNTKKLIYVIGSVNEFKDPLFDPFTNPLNLDQQIQQFRTVFPIYDPIFLPIPDTKEMSDWGPFIIKALDNVGINPDECAIHFIGKSEDKISKACSFINKKNGELITLEPGQWLIEALAYYEIPIWFDNEFPVDLNISARNFREIDLKSPQAQEYLPAQTYLYKIAKEAKLKDDKTPVTLRDLSLNRIRIES